MPILSQRQSRILSLIVEGYVATGSPVSSSALATDGRLNVSPATVRNEMAALEDEGLIVRPHISAGGVPSDKGYRHFVESLDVSRPVSEADGRFLSGELASAPSDVEMWPDSASLALSALLNTLAFATPPLTHAPHVKGIELLRLQEMLIMMVLILQEASVHRQLISLETAVSDSQIESTRNRVNDYVSGMDAAALSTALESTTDTFEQQVVLTAMDALRRREGQLLSDRKVQGISRLFSQPEMSSSPDQARNLVSAVEDVSVFVTLTKESPEDGDPVAVIGRENRHETLQGFSVVSARYGRSGDAQGIVGVIAPTRMDYSRALPAVRHTAWNLSQMASIVYGD